MKYKNISKLIPLCVLFSLTACNEITTFELEFAGQKLRINYPSDKEGYVKRTKRILETIEPYADPAYNAKVFDQYLEINSHGEKVFNFSRKDLLLSTMICNLLNSKCGYKPYDNGYKEMWKKVLSEGRSEFNDEERPIAEQLQSELLNANIKYGPEWLCFNGDYSFDVRPVINSYAIGQIRQYLGAEYSYHDIVVDDYTVKIGDSDIYFGTSSDFLTSITFDGPCGKPILLNGVDDYYNVFNDTFVNITSCVNSKIVIGDKTASPDFIDEYGPWVKNDAVVTIMAGRYHTDMSSGVTYAFEKIKKDVSEYDYSSEEESHIYSIVFKDDQIVYCSPQLDVEYEGASYGAYGGQTVQR